MSDRGLWSRLKTARLVQVLAVYLGASWVVLQVVQVLQEGLRLPAWIVPVTLILLAVGLLVVLATAWVQSHPLVEAKEEAREVPGDWELALAGVVDSVGRGEIPHLTWARTLMGGVFVFSLLFGAAGLYVVVQDRGESFQPPPLFAGESAPSVAVLPFRVTGADLQEWEEGLVDLLSTGLDGAAGLRAVDSRTLLSHWDREVGDDERPDLATALAVASGTGARFALEGSVVSMGETVRLVARIHDLESGARLGSAQVQGSLDAPHGLVDRLSMEVLEVLLADGSAQLPEIDLAAVTTTSTEALKAYLQGQRHYREGRFEAAREAYEEAVAVDSTFALAYHQLYLTVGWVGLSGSPLQARYAERARELLDRLPDRERLLVSGTYRMVRSTTDPTRLETTLEEAVELYPSDAEVRYLLAETYFHEPNYIISGREMEQVFERAIELDPTMAAYRIHHIEAAFVLHGDSALADRRIRAYEELTSPNDPWVSTFQLASDIAFGTDSARADALDRYFAASTAGTYFRQMRLLLGHPLVLPRQEEFLRRGVAEAPRNTMPESVPVQLLVDNMVAQGRIAEAVEFLEHPALRNGGGSHRRCVHFVLAYGGYPVSESRLRAEAGREAVEDEPGQGGVLDALCRAGIAAFVGAEGPLREAESRVADLRVRFMEEERDEPLPGFVDRRLAGAEAIPGAFWAWKQEGRTAQALRDFERSRFRGFPPSVVMGDLFREVGRTRDALVAYQDRWTDIHAALTQYRLARLQEELGNETAAREAWRMVRGAWENADPELQDRVREARERIAALE